MWFLYSALLVFWLAIAPHATTEDLIISRDLLFVVSVMILSSLIEVQGTIVILYSERNLQYMHMCGHSRIPDNLSLAVCAMCSLVQ